MSFVKLQRPRKPNELELEYIKMIERTHDKYGLSFVVIQAKLSSNGFKLDNARQVRDMNERYNNFKYEGITPQGRVFKINGLYRLVTLDSKHMLHQHTKSYKSMLAGIQDFRNSCKVYGDVHILNNMTIEELMEELDNE